jgi:hypothetical protein
VDAWDFAHRSAGEPGNDPAAPYHAQHLVATDLEWRMVHALGIDEQAYNGALEDLCANDLDDENDEIPWADATRPASEQEE